MFGIDDALIAAGVSGASSLVGGMMSNASTAQQSNLALGMNAYELQNSWNNTAAENSKMRDFNADQASRARDWTGEQNALTRDFNAAEAAKARDATQSYLNQSMGFNADQAQKQREYESWMSSTAYQRATQDMRKAGINPMLAYMQGGASTPSGSSASVGSPSAAQASAGSAGGPAASAGALGYAAGGGNQGARFNDVVSPAVASALQAYRVVNEMDQTKTATKNLDAQRQTQIQLTNKTAGEAAGAQYADDIAKAQIRQINAGTNESMARATKTAEETNQLKQAGPGDYRNVNTWLQSGKTLMNAGRSGIDWLESLSPNVPNNNDGSSPNPSSPRSAWDTINITPGMIPNAKQNYKYNNRIYR